MCKLFADDTTLGDVDKDLITLINRFVEKIKSFFKICAILINLIISLNIFYLFNKLDINWSKTNFMFVTNRRVKIPKQSKKRQQVNFCRALFKPKKL